MDDVFSEPDSVATSHQTETGTEHLHQMISGISQTNREHDPEMGFGTTI